MCSEHRQSSTNIRSLTVPNIQPFHMQQQQLPSQQQQQSGRASNLGSTCKPNLHEREINLAITLVSISILFVICQSFKLVPDMYELVSLLLTKPLSNNSQPD